MARKKLFVALIQNDLTKTLVYCPKEHNIDVLVFLNKTQEEAEYEIKETAWQDRAEWVSMVPFRAYAGWIKNDVIAMEELLKNPDVDNVYVDY